MALNDGTRVRAKSWFPAGASALFVLAVALLIQLLLDQSRAWVQSDYAVHLPRSMQNGIALQPFSDLLNTIATSASLDQRARFLPYFLIAIDQKLRLVLGEFFPVPPALNPVLWLLHGVLGPMLLFRYIATATESKAAGLVAVAVYLSSPGFLYVFTMNWLPQKALVNLGFLLVLWLGARMDRRMPAGALLFSGSAAQSALLLATMLALFLTDEYGFFAPPLVLVMFWWRFVRAGGGVTGGPGVMKNFGMLLLPAAAFAALMLVVVPALSRTLYGIRFSYLQALSTGARRAAGAAGGAWLQQAVSTPAHNLANLMGISLAPYDLTGISGAFPRHFGVQVMGPVQALAAAAFVCLLLAAARTTPSGSLDAGARRLWPAAGAYVLAVWIVSLLALSHEPRIISGFYYGGAIAVIFAVLVAFVVRYTAGAARILAMILACWIVLVQYLNFDRLNSIWSTGSDAYVAELYRPYLPLGAARDRWSLRDIDELGSSAREGKLDAYLDERALPPRLFYVVAEQCVKNPAVSSRCGALLGMLRHAAGSP